LPRVIEKIPVVYVPAELEAGTFTGPVYGYHHPDSQVYNIVAWGAPSELPGYETTTYLGTIIEADDSKLSEEHTPAANQLVGRHSANGITFTATGVPCVKKPYNLTQNIFSRNQGILETNWMLDKRAIISGCGSVGSFVALELARAGVGTFLLIDNDVIEYHNLCRHQCGIADVGKAKVHALKERILQINALAQVDTCQSIVEMVDKATWEAHSQPGAIIIGCVDNREGDIWASKIASRFALPFVSIGFWERAFAGEIFYHIPEEGPCYVCPFENPDGGFSARTSTNRRFYTTEEDLARVNFEPGISADINFVTIVALKIILDILNRDRQDYIPRVLDQLTQFTLVCNTNNPNIGGEQAEIFAHPLQITTSVHVNYEAPCPPCKER
jgi:molybdopterin/thiamine biosynthesis adenylyltransferase